MAPIWLIMNLLIIILYRYFIALREIYQNVCPEVPGNPQDVIFPDAEGVNNSDSGNVFISVKSWECLLYNDV